MEHFIEIIVIGLLIVIFEGIMIKKSKGPKSRYDR